MLSVYEKGRQWSLQHPDELKQVLVKEAKLTDAVAAKQLERTDFSSARIGDAQKNAISAAGDVLKKSGVIKESINIAQTVGELVDPQFMLKVASK